MVFGANVSWVFAVSMSIEFFVFITTIVVVVALAIFLAVAAVSLWTVISTLSVAFSRLAISILISGGILFTDFDFKIVESGFFNFLIKLAIVYGIIWLASFVPRLEPAIGTLCTFFVSLLTTLLTLGFGTAIIDKIFDIKEPTQNTLWFAIVSGLCITIITLINWLRDINKIKEMAYSSKLFKSAIFTRIGRVLSSIIYGFVLMLIISMYMGMPTLSNFTQAMMLVGCSAVAYLGDLFLFDRVAPKKTKQQ